MERRIKWGVFLLAFSLGTIFSSGTSLSQALSPEEKSGGSRHPSGKAPNFSLKDLKGRRVELKDFLGKGPVLLDFWALWCSPCLKEMPHIEKIYRKYRKSGLKVLAINGDSPRTAARVKPYIKSHGYTFHVLMDREGRVYRDYNVPGIPYLVVLDKYGDIRHTHFGYRAGDERILEGKLIELLQGVEEGGDR